MSLLWCYGSGYCVLLCCRFFLANFYSVLNKYMNTRQLLKASLITSFSSCFVSSSALVIWTAPLDSTNELTNFHPSHPRTTQAIQSDLAQNSQLNWPSSVLLVHFWFISSLIYCHMNLSLSGWSLQGTVLGREESASLLLVYCLYYKSTRLRLSEHCFSLLRARILRIKHFKELIKKQTDCRSFELWEFRLSRQETDSAFSLLSIFESLLCLCLSNCAESRKITRNEKRNVWTR